jgi:phosphate transport system substrate-binding protein
MTTSLMGQTVGEHGYPYAPDKPLAGELEIVGSTLMQQVGSLWLSKFQETHPDVQGTIDCRGSESSLPQMTSAKPILGMLSRKISDEELSQLAQSTKQKFQTVIVGYDILAVIVHPDNPIEALPWNWGNESLWNQGSGKRVARWSDLGDATKLGKDQFQIYLPSKEHGLRSMAERFLMRDLDASQVAIQELPNPADISDAVSKDQASIALVSATRAKSKKVKPVPIQVSGTLAVSPLDSQCIAEGYPLVRELSLFFAVDDGGARNPLVEEFLAFVLSRSGQRIMTYDGFLPLTPSSLEEQREKLGWEVIK